MGVQSRGETMEIKTRLVPTQHGIDPNSVGYSAVGHSLLKELYAEPRASG